MQWRNDTRLHRAVLEQTRGGVEWNGKNGSLTIVSLASCGGAKRYNGMAQSRVLLSPRNRDLANGGATTSPAAAKTSFER
jgi:hypothetical protein